MPNTQHDPTTPKSEGAEWVADFRKKLCCTLPDGTEIVGCHDKGEDREVEYDFWQSYKVEQFIAHQRQQAYAEGYKQGSFDKEADLELGVVRGQAVAEFAREVLAGLPELLPVSATKHSCIQNEVSPQKRRRAAAVNFGRNRTVEATLSHIRTLAKERGIDLNN